MSEEDSTVSSLGDGDKGLKDERLQELAGFLGVPIDTIAKFDNHVIIEHVAAKAHEFNGLQSRNMKLYATIDEMRALSDKRIDSLKSEVGKLLSENDSIKHGRVELEEQVSQLTQEKTQALGQVENLSFELKNSLEQKDALRSSNQDIVKLLDEKNSELDASKLESEKLLEENRDLRKKVLDVENEVQTLKCNELRDKSEVEFTKQQLTLLTKSNEWLEKEVTSKTEQLIKYRQQNDTELQKALKDLASLRNDFQVEKSSKEAILVKNQELSHSLQEKLFVIKDLTDSLNSEKQEFSREMSLKQKLIDLLEAQIDSLQKELQSTVDKSSLNTLEGESSNSEREKLIEDLARVKEKLENSESERLRLEAVVKEVLGDNEENDRNDDASSASSNTGRLSIPKLCGDLGILKKQLIRERHQKENLQRQVESFIVELEYKIPVINSFKQRTSMLEKELNDIALLLEHTSNEKEKKERELEATCGKVKQYESNIHTLIRQRSDLARQVQFLLLNISVHSDSRGPLTADEVAFIRKIVNNEDPSNDSDSQNIISERLVEFKDIAMLQEKNSELLKTVRNLADKLEEEEHSGNKKIDTIENETIKEAKEAIVILQDYNSKMESKIRTIEKERDAYKAILSTKEKTIGELENSSSKNSTSEKEELVKNLEARLSSLTAESSKNNQMLNEEIRKLYSTKSQLTVLLEKEKSSRTLAEERLKLVQCSVDLTKKENLELIKRSQHLQDIMSEQEARMGGTINEYVSCKSQLSVLDSKTRNLESEKALLNSTIQSLRNELQKGSEEGSSLKIMVAQLQTLQGERERLLEEAHASYKAKLDQLELTNAEMRSSINGKDEEIKALEGSKRTEIQWYQEKIDALTKEVNASRDELVLKAGTINKLELEVKNLKKDLQESKSRIDSHIVLNDLDNDDSIEKRLRKDLEKTRIQLNDAYSQLEEYKQLSSATEESLKSISEEFNRNKEQSDSIIKKYLSEKSELEKNVAGLNQQIDFLNNEYALQKNKSEEEKNGILKKLISLESKEEASSQLRNEYDEKLNQLQRDLELQTTYALSAQTNYEQELQKHAEVAKTISELRSKAQADKSEIENLKSLQQQAKEIMENDEKSWLVQKTEFENQLESARNQIVNLSDQNKLLFDQLESFSQSGHEPDRKLAPENGQLLINLRRERDILETKLSVSKREQKLLLQKQSVLENELGEARTKLLKLQESDSAHSEIAKQHENIMEQLNQLNLLRESNITLRNTANAANEKNNELQKDLDELRSKLLPLETEVASCHRSMAEKDQRIQLFKDEAKRWKERSHDILRQHEKIDPEEYKKLQDEVSSLQSQLEDRQKENSDLNDRFSRLKKQAHEKLNASKISQANLNTELTELHETKTKLEEALKEAQVKMQDLETLLSEKSGDSVTVDSLRRELDAALEKSKEIEVKLNDTVGSSDSLTSQLNEEIKALKEEIKALREKPADTIDEGIARELSNVVESMKATFEEEKISFIREKTNEFDRKLEEEKSKLSSEKEHPGEREDVIDLAALKKQWEEEYEKAALRRIREAEENLKKRIRKPTEDRINKVLEKRKAELEEEYKEKSRQTSSSSASQDGSVREDIKKQLEKELEAKYQENLNTTKKKAFEEGKQQAAMKTTLLERKISKLESQLHDSEKLAGDKGAAPSVVSSGMPSKIDERSPENMMGNNILTSGEKVLKLNDKSAFNFQSAPKSNPFTSSQPVNDKTFAMKPTFSLSNGSAQTQREVSLPLGAEKPATASPEPESEPEVLAAPPSASSIAKANEETPDTGATTPQKRAVDSEEHQEVANKREKHSPPST